MEEQPRILELRGADIQKVNHAYGTNGVITELEMPLAPAYRWAELLVALPDLMTAARCADAIAHEDAILKKLVSVIAAPVAHDWLFPDRLAAGENCGHPDGRRLRARCRCTTRWRHGPRASPTRASSTSWRRRQQPLFEYTWNHTTLHALKHDRTITYLQTLFPAPRHLDKVAEMAAALRRRGADAPRVRPLRRRDRLLRPAAGPLHHATSGCLRSSTGTTAAAARSSTRTSTRWRAAG